MDLGNLLKGLGLERFETTFRDNGIDDSVLPHLTQDHLRELGIPLGARIKLLAAIAGHAKQSDSHTPGAMAAEGSAADAAERRQITVLFCDLVGSTPLSTRMDPEDLRKLISAYQKCVTEVVQRFGGFVAKYMGDGVLIYFGYPEAHEDDAERAVRSGLELVSEVVKLKTGTPLQTRVGIATGLVVVGDLVGSGQAQERGIVGETPNLAARLQGFAEPDTVVIADATRQLLGNLFELRDLGLQELKGIAGAVQIWAPVRPTTVEGRFEAFHRTDLTSLVGRDEESQLLLRRWSSAKDGEGQVVLVCGEPGIGKSRLTAALLEEVNKEPHARLRCFCSPQRTNSALSPVIGHFERAAGLKHDDTIKMKLDRFDTLLGRSATSPTDSALLAEMLSLSNDGRYPALTFDPQQRRQKTLEALLNQIEALSRSTPVLMIFEDVHWTDPTTLELLGRIVNRIEALSVLLVITFRPEFQPPWIGLPHVAAVTINRLGRRHIDAIIDRIVGNKFLAPDIREDLIDRTDGIPLFIEEMTKAILEAESEEDARRTTASIPSPKLEIPATLHASLMARLDRLGSAKELAQIGSAIGREFSHALIEAVARKPQADLDNALQRLISAGLLFRQGVPPHAHYLFKHALVQDAAYSTLLREHRRALHKKIVEALETRFADIVERQPELLARHCSDAGLIEKAAKYWAEAGQRSLERAALPEAAEQLNRSLTLIASLPSTPALRQEEIKLQVALINPLLHVMGYAAPETKAAVERARVLIEQAEAHGESPVDPLLLFTVLYGFWVANIVAFNGDAMRELAAQFLALAEQQGTTAPLMIGHRLMGWSLLHIGEIPKGRVHLDRAIALHSPAEHRPLATRFGHDSGTAILCCRSLALWFLGYPEAALKDTVDALTNARELGQAPTLMYALVLISFTHFQCGNYATANAQLDELVALADEKGALFWKAWGTMQRGCVSALTGKFSDAVHAIKSGITSWRSTGSNFWLPLYLSYLARTYAELGQCDDGRHCIAEAIAAVETTKEKWCEAEVHRIAGEIALLAPERDIAKAETHFERALAVAQEQQAKSWELRAAMSLARLWRDQGERAKARELLAGVFDWFHEGFETLDLQQAKTLLNELG